MVATSTEARDDRVVEIAAEAGVDVVRGSEADVLGRTLRALDQHPPADHVVRLTADCPWSDPGVVAAVVAAHLEGGADYTSNTLLRSWPDGLDVEVTTTDALRVADRAADPGPEREHVTPHLQRHPERFLVQQVVHPLPQGERRWTVDTEADLVALRGAARPEAVAVPWTDLRSQLPASPRVPGDLRLRPLVRAEPGLDRCAAAALAEQRWSNRLADGGDGADPSRWLGAPGEDIVRPWVVEAVGADPDEPGVPRGWIAVTCAPGGSASVAASLPPELRAPSQRLLALALGADAQTTHVPVLLGRAEQTAGP